MSRFPQIGRRGRAARWHGRALAGANDLGSLNREIVITYKRRARDRWLLLPAGVQPSFSYCLIRHDSIDSKSCSLPPRRGKPCFPFAQATPVTASPNTRGIGRLVPAGVGRARSDEQFERLKQRNRWWMVFLRLFALIVSRQYNLMTAS